MVNDTSERLLRLRTRLSESVNSQILRLSNFPPDDLISPAETAMIADTRASLEAVDEMIANLEAEEAARG
ncbi:hypothetical protein [Pelagibius sp. Alg239-R121]|uniref:hypothetical protein n=1 Tax=Pelagibius sp. Alg239-R121 TaxID=2993448 RepID=UPI0024A78D2E|nr:hypothetical protein [Pelagibius sp. Alg239-R121]